MHMQATRTLWTGASLTKGRLCSKLSNTICRLCAERSHKTVTEPQGACRISFRACQIKSAERPCRIVLRLKSSNWAISLASAGRFFGETFSDYADVCLSNVRFDRFLDEGSCPLISPSICHICSSSRLFLSRSKDEIVSRTSWYSSLIRINLGSELHSFRRMYKESIISLYILL
jgi:hypothetical protein